MEAKGDAFVGGKYNRSFGFPERGYGSAAL